MLSKFAISVALAATTFLSGCASDTNGCVDGKRPDGTPCSQSTGGGATGSVIRGGTSGGSSSGTESDGTHGVGGFGEGHGGGEAGS